MMGVGRHWLTSTAMVVTLGRISDIQVVEERA